MKKKEIPKILEEEYNSLKPILKKCFVELKRIIVNQLSKVQDPKLVRIRLTDGRIKSLVSLWRKAKKKKWKTKAVLKEIKDIVGFRIVCENIEDIYRVKELLISSPRIKEIPESEEDRIKTPTPSGYRDFKFCIEYETYNPKYNNVICEIQIRTLLQNSWAILNHKDIYKEGDDLPEYLKKSSYRLSQLLSIADQIAQDIRDYISRKRKPLKRKGKLVSENTLRILFKEVFGVLPPDYLVRFVKNKCNELRIKDIKPLEEALLSEKNQKQLKKAYEKSTGWDITNELIFEILPFIVAYGIEIASDAVSKRGKQEWFEIDQIYKREITSELPNTYRDFLEYLEPHTKDDHEDFPDRIYRLAEVLKAIEECSICGTPTVDEEIFSENAQEYYKKEDLEGKIANAILNSGVEINKDGLCTYHDYHKDD